MVRQDIVVFESVVFVYLACRVDLLSEAANKQYFHCII